mgnify:CR=1 FL=1
MDMLGVVFTILSASVVIESTVRKEVPSSFRLIGKEHIGSVVPSAESVHFLGKSPGVTVGVVVHPMSHGAFEIASVGVDLSWELMFEAREHIVERQGVR